MSTIKIKFYSNADKSDIEPVVAAFVRLALNGCSNVTKVSWEYDSALEESGDPAVAATISIETRED